MNDQYQTSREQVVFEVLALLAAGQYMRLQELTGGDHLSAIQIQQAVVGYGRTGIPLPESAAQEINYIEIGDSLPKKCIVLAPVFMQEEGHPTLLLELTLIECGPLYRVVLDGLHLL